MSVAVSRQITSDPEPVGGLRSFIAGRTDDAALQELHSAVPVVGRLDLRFMRNPSFFAGPESLGTFEAVAVCESGNQSTQISKAHNHPDLAGMLSRSVRPVYLNGTVQDVAYINHLRLRPGCKSIPVLVRLCAELHRLQESRPAALTLATISEGNRNALGILVEKPLKSFPRLFPLESFVSFTIPARKKGRSDPKFHLNRLPTNQPFPILDSAATKNFFPAVDRWSWESLSEKGLAPEHAMHASDGSTAVFHGALWDQSASKQVQVTKLSPTLARIRPVYNLWSRFAGRAGIPAPGELLKILTLSFVGVKDNSPDVFAAILPGLRHETHRRGFDQFVVTFSARDPLAAAARRVASMSYGCTLYAVAFDHQEPKFVSNNRIGYLDAAFL